MSDYLKKLNKEVARLDKNFEHITKVDERTWLVQKNKNSYVQSFFVSLLNGAIVMYGDYDGVMLMPNESRSSDLIRWMANCTSIDYFCEKVRRANQYHEVKQWDEQHARDHFAYWLEGREFQYTNSKGERCHSTVTEITANMIRARCNNKTVRYPPYLEDMMDAIGWIDFSDKSAFYDSLDMFMDEVSMDYDYEWYEVGMTYTSQIMWQHKLLVMWARKVLEESE